MKIITTVILLLYIANLQSQQLLTPDSAIQIALKNNYDILISKNDAEIAKINNSVGNAGMLPNISLTGTGVFTNNSSNSKQTSGVETKTNNSTSQILNSSLALNWIIFDGGKMFVTKNKLQEIQNLGEVQFKEKVLQTIYNVTVAYYDVVKQKQQLAFINEVIEFNKQRVKILKTSFGAGLIPKTSLLQAKIDLNVFRENAINQQAIIVASKRSLNLILARDSNEFNDVIDSITINYNIDTDYLKTQIFKTNNLLIAAQKQLLISQLSTKEFTRSRFPKISINAAYNIYKSDYTQNNLIYNNYNGPSFGASISIPIFQAGTINRQVAVAKTQLLTANYMLLSIQNSVYTQLINAITQFENQQELLIIEEENTVLAEENLKISLERLRLGQTTSLEMRQAQESFEDSKTRLINFQYNLKVAETKLKQLTGRF
jgi:outer membrane protein